MKRMLIQTQLSNYDTNGKFILECDSGWQMMAGRVRVMLDMVPDLYITLMGPRTSQLMTQPERVSVELFAKHSDRVKYLEHKIIPNALATRYDFDFDELGGLLFGKGKEKYDYVYLNDPMLLRNYRALFFVEGKYLPKFFVHSHFIDNPACPKFPKEASLWMGQCEAARKADYNFWQCESSMETFFEEMSKEYLPHIVDEVKAKSSPWDDGYSIDEISSDIDFTNIRFDDDAFDELTRGKKVIFVPNRIGGMGRSSDYTNCGKFMFEVLPELRKLRDDFVVVAGNPSQKIFNHELEELCGKNGYMNLVPNAFNRDEFKFIASNSDIAVGLYDQDTYGGTVARECIEQGCIPFWLDNFEYAAIARETGHGMERFLAKPDFSDIVEKLSLLMDNTNKIPYGSLFEVVRERCAYERTTEKALKLMGIV